MNARHLIFALSFTLGAIFAQGQIKVKSTEQDFIEKAVLPGLFISQQSFQICDPTNGDLFGLNGNEEFDVIYSLGIKLPNGILLTDKAVRPWKYSVEYRPYASEYDPVFHKANFTEVSGDVAYTPLHYNASDVKMLADTTLYYFKTDSFGNIGFETDMTTGNKNGWVVWIYPEHNEQLSTGNKLSTSIYQKEMEVDNEGKPLEISLPNSNVTPLGGLFLVPQYDVPGIIVFKLCGIMCLDEDNWKVWFPFVDTNLSRGENTANTETSKSKLTPVSTKPEAKETPANKNGKKKKK